MKCIKYGDLSLIQTIAMPKAKRNHLLVQVQAAGLNPVDAKNVIGDKLPDSWKTAHSLVHWSIRSNIPGFDFSGVCVEPFGPYDAGDRVFGTMPPFHGSLAEFVNVPLHQVARMPESLSFEQAAALPLVGYVQDCTWYHIVFSCLRFSCGHSV